MTRLLSLIVVASAIVGGISSSSPNDGYRYRTSQTAPFLIEHLPEIDFDIGELYGGSVAINDSDPSRSLFFLFKPAQGEPSNDLTIWLGGGPGCSSIDSFLQENGPVLWQPGMFKALRNPYSWAKHTNMLWVDQPVGAGFSVGEVTARNEKDIAHQFLGFLQNWENIFGIENYRIFMTGVSDAGRFVPYISAAMLDRHDKRSFDVQGNLMYSPAIGDDYAIGRCTPMWDFIQQTNIILNFDAATMRKIERTSVNCGFSKYIDQYLQFPPPKIQPPPELPIDIAGSKCDLFAEFILAGGSVNACFQPGFIVAYCPFLADNLVSQPPGWSPETLYYNRHDVKEAIHAPMNVTWIQCVPPGVSVFAAGPQGPFDMSPNPIETVLPQVIESTNRVLISHGNWDGNLLANGTMLAIQNMTWGGKLGFQAPPSKDFRVPVVNKFSNGFAARQGVMGMQHYERGLMWTEVHQAGHTGPQYQPRAALRQLQWVLRQIEDL